MPVPPLRFDFVDTLGLPAPVCFTHPDRIIVARRLDEVRGAMRAVEEGLREGFYAAGFVSYEAAPAFDEALTTRAASDLPLLWFALCGAPVAGEPLAPTDTPRDADASAGLLESWAPDVTPDAYRHGVDTIRQAIQRGDAYQVNYTFRLRASLADDPARGSDSHSSGDSGRGSGGPAVDRAALDDLYRRLARAQRAPCSASLDLGRWRLLSLSPELFFRLRDGRITTKPMKGTAARGRWIEDDEARAAWLASSEKNRAENVMIVDLARNDVGRIAEIGTVRAASLFEVERYPTVFQMVSTVDGAVRPGTTLGDVFAALFPAGSITGAPKSSSMRLIASIEQAPRGAYCGAIGFATPSGDAVFNVAIRTAVIDVETGRAEYGVGGGITWDSTAAAEYEEALSKAAVWAPAPTFDLLETMRLERGAYVRRAGHVRRLMDSARHLASCGLFEPPRSPPVGASTQTTATDPADDGSTPDADAIKRALDAHAREHPVEARRVRLFLSRSGDMRVESTPLAPAERGAPLRVLLARTPVSRADPLLYHKTTRRAVYDERFAEVAHGASHDVVAVLLWNEARELTEFTIGNLVMDIDGIRCTPPRWSGLLGGVLRAELLAAGEIVERALTIDDLPSARRLWMINSVRGWVDAAL